jgi:hypothetical protein
MKKEIINKVIVKNNQKRKTTKKTNMKIDYKHNKINEKILNMKEISETDKITSNQTVEVLMVQ